MLFFPSDSKSTGGGCGGCCSSFNKGVNEPEDLFFVGSFIPNFGDKTGVMGDWGLTPAGMLFSEDGLIVPHILGGMCSFDGDSTIIFFRFFDPPTLSFSEPFSDNEPDPITGLFPLTIFISPFFFSAPRV
jgi:hypothetical protein